MDEWERMNMSDPDAEKLKAEVIDVNATILSMDCSMACLMRVAKRLDGTTAYDRLISIVDAMDELTSELKAMSNAFKRGEMP